MKTAFGPTPLLPSAWTPIWPIQSLFPPRNPGAIFLQKALCIPRAALAFTFGRSVSILYSLSPLAPFATSRCREHTGIVDFRGLFWRLIYIFFPCSKDTIDPGRLTVFPGIFQFLSHPTTFWLSASLPAARYLPCPSDPGSESTLVSNLRSLPSDSVLLISIRIPLLRLF